MHKARELFSEGAQVVNLVNYCLDRQAPQFAEAVNAVKLFNQFDLANANEDKVVAEVKAIQSFILRNDLQSHINAALDRAVFINPGFKFEPPTVILLYAGPRTNARVFSEYQENSFALNMGNLLAKDESDDAVLRRIESLITHETIHLFIKQLLPPIVNSLQGTLWEEGLTTYMESVHMPWHEDFKRMVAEQLPELMVVMSDASSESKFAALETIINHPTYAKWFERVREELVPMLAARSELKLCATKALIHSNGPIYHLGFLLWEFKLQQGHSLPDLVMQGHNVVGEWLEEFRAVRLG